MMTNEQKAAERAIRLAQEMIDWVSRAGVNYSESTVRYELAKVLHEESSQSTVRRLHERFAELNRRVPA